MLWATQSTACYMILSSKDGMPKGRCRPLPLDIQFATQVLLGRLPGENSTV